VLSVVRVCEWATRLATGAAWSLENFLQLKLFGRNFAVLGTFARLQIIILSASHQVRLDFFSCG
jgi:hypothetical protein